MGDPVAPLREGERGSALLLVLAVVAVLSLIAGVVIRTGGLERRIAANAEEVARARALADAGILLAIQAMLTPERRALVRLDGQPFEVSFHGRTIRISAQDQAGLVDLNTGSPQSISAVLNSGGLSQEEAQLVAARIADWRDADTQSREGGAERSDYEKAERPVLPRDAPIEEIDEIGAILGIPSLFLSTIRDELTVFSGRSEPDPDLRPIASRRGRGNVSEVPFGSAGSQTTTTLPGKVISFRAEVDFSRDGKSARRAVIRFTGDAARPYLVHDWRND